MQVIFKKSDGTAEKTIDVLPDSKLGESREAIQMLLGLPEHQPCKLVLARSNKELEDSLTFQEAGIQPNDKLILSSLAGQEIKPPQEVSQHPVSSSPPPPTTVASPTSASVQSTGTSGLTGLKEWQKAAITGCVIGAFILTALIITRTSSQTSQPTQPQQEQTPSPSNPPPRQEQITSEPTYIPPESSLSEQEAVNLIQRWQNAKPEIFAPPFNRQLGTELLTGKAYHDNIRRTDGGESSVDWLQNKNAYYTYGVQNIDGVNKFVASGDYATIEVTITEERTLYINGKPSKDENTTFDTSVIRYTLQNEDGQWKIADYKSL